MLASREFTDDIQMAGIEVIPLSGERLQELVDGLTAIPPDIVDKVKAAYGG